MIDWCDAEGMIDWCDAEGGGAGVTWKAAKDVQGEGFALTGGAKQRDSSLWLKRHCVAAVDGDNAIVLSETAAPEVARCVDAIYSHSKVG